jgi:transmembrane sensor
MPDLPVKRVDVDASHLAAAADWFVQLGEDDSAQARQAWQRWHDAAPGHRLAWERVQKMQGLLATAPPQSTKVLEQPQPTSRRHFVAGIGALVASGLGYVLMQDGAGARPVEWLATARGERRSVTLADGGRVWLGSDTRLGIDYGTSRRELHLAQGTMQLTSGSDPRQRPLRIVARDGVVLPLGTRLTMALFKAHTLVAVQEHAAEVRPLNGPALLVRAGQRLAFTRTGGQQPAPAPLAEDAWTRGLVLALDTPLAQFAEQFSLYSGQGIEVAPAIAQRLVSGTFQLDAPERSLRTLAQVLAIRADKLSDGWRLRAR